MTHVRARYYRQFHLLFSSRFPTSTLVDFYVSVFVPFFILVIIGHAHGSRLTNFLVYVRCAFFIWLLLLAVWTFTADCRPSWWCSNLRPRRLQPIVYTQVPPHSCNGSHVLNVNGAFNCQLTITERSRRATLLSLISSSAAASARRVKCEFKVGAYGRAFDLRNRSP